MWPEFRVFELSEQFGQLRQKKIRFTFLSSYETDFIEYFHDEILNDFSLYLDPDYVYVPPRKGLDDIELVILTNHGSDMYENIWELRSRFPSETVIAVWLWDNHLNTYENFKTAISADIVFASHNYISDYLYNPASIIGTHIPSCTAQWGCSQSKAYFTNSNCILRSNKLLVNYVDYEFSWRSRLLSEIRSSDIEAEVFLMHPDDRTRYFSKNKLERMLEWRQYKSTIILPLTNDLSTRVFDALLSGLIIIVPENIFDFDKVFSFAEQDELGIIKIPDFSVTTIKSAHERAIDFFDAKGEAGMRFRHNFVLENHMLVHRINQILNEIKLVASADAEIAFKKAGDITYCISRG